mgnify:CR=1 FL=1
MKAINYYIIVKKIKEKEKKIAGLLVTENTDVDNRYAKAKVVSTGNLAQGVADNDTVYYDKHAGHSITWKDELYMVITISDVVLVE